MDLANGLPVVAVWVADLPRDVLPILNETAKEVGGRNSGRAEEPLKYPCAFMLVYVDMYILLLRTPRPSSHSPHLSNYSRLLQMVMEEFAEFGEAQPEIFVRLANIPLEESIRDLRHFHLNQLVRVDGVVTRRTGIYPQLQQIRYDCGACGAVLGPFVQTGEREVRPLACPSCEARGPFTINARETVYRNYQKVTLQEPPGSVPAGRLPRSKDVILLADLVDGVRPGEEVVVTGIFQHSYEAGANARHGFPVYGTSIEAVHLARRGERYSGARLTDEDRAEIRALARDPRIARRIVKSIAPSIYGHESVKLGVALALFGGQEKHPGGTGSHRLRGDINVLLLGDPGTAKSQFLKYLERVAHRAVYTTGKGASAVGLTASVHKDAITGEWTLEGGALVLADRGVCLIDEFDKMNDADRVSIHEAMEQQSISISKAGIVTQLQARCSVVAAANPVGGRYDASKTFRENVELTDPILSRFDVLCVIRDTVDAVNDARLASFVVASHAKSHPDNSVGGGELEGGVVAVADGSTTTTTTTTTPPSNPPDDLAPLSQEMLRKYVTYAKQAVRPRLQAADHDKIAQVYAELRREAALTQGMPIAVRHLESMVRMAEARAAMHLRDAVSSDDIDAAIRVMLESFIGTQKLSVQKVLRRKFRRFVVDRADFDALALFKLRECLREARRAESVTGARADERNFSVPVRQLEERCRDLDIVDLQPFFKSATFHNAGFALSSDGSQVLLPRA